MRVRSHNQNTSASKRVLKHFFYNHAYIIHSSISINNLPFNYKYINTYNRILTQSIITISQVCVTYHLSHKCTHNLMHSNASTSCNVTLDISNACGTVSSLLEYLTSNIRLYRINIIRYPSLLEYPIYNNKIHECMYMFFMNSPTII